MAVRNFWVEGDIDGRESKAKGGPRRKDGGMEVTIYQRDEGSITTAVRVDCSVTCDDKLVTSIYDNKGTKIFEHITDR